MKIITLSVIIAILIILGAIVYSSRGPVGANDITANNVSIVDGKQIVEINVKGGYQPRKSIAKSGIPTVIRFNTKGTYDCSIAVRIPSLKISKNLAPTNVTDIEIETPGSGTLEGMCAMGMYSFEIEFIP